MKPVPSLLTVAALVLCAAGVIVPLAIPVRSADRSPNTRSVSPGTGTTPPAAPAEAPAASAGRRPGDDSAGRPGDSGRGGDGRLTGPGSRSAITRAIVRFLEPDALALRLGRVAASAGTTSPIGPGPVSSSGTAPGGRSDRPPRRARPGDRQPGSRKTPPLPSALPRPAALEKVASLFGEAFIARPAPTARPGSEARLRARPDADPLGEALDLLQVCFEGTERDALERQLLEWAGELEQLLAAADLDLETLNAQGQEALDAARGPLRSRLQHRHDELVKALRATGKTVPDDRVDLDTILSPEKLAETMRALRDLADQAH